MIQILIALGQAYYNQGFINIPVAHEVHFGIHGMPVNIYLGTWAVAPRIGHIDRNNVINHAPRIMMGANYTHWVQANHILGQNLVVTFNNPLYPNSILIQ